MKHKLLKLSVVLLFVFALTGLQAQTMYVREKSGTQTDYTLSDIMKMSFSSGNITVSIFGGSSDTYALTNIRYLNFTDLTTGIHLPEHQNEAGKLQVFPNPVNNMLNIQYTMPEKQLVALELLSIEGKVVYKQVLTNNTYQRQINVSALPKGLYLCRIIGKKTIDTIKFIKN